MVGDLRKLRQKNSIIWSTGAFSKSRLTGFGVPPEADVLKAVLKQFAFHSCFLDGVCQLR